MVSRSPNRAAQEPLLGLLEIGRALRAGGDLQSMLAAVASAVRRATRFTTIVINLHRPAWDDFEVVVVEGSPGARAQLLGVTTTWPEWRGLLDDRFDRGGAYFIPAGEADWTLDAATFIPDIAPSEDPEALTAAMVELVGDLERAAAYGETARVIAEQRFTIEATIEAYLEMYRGLLPTAAI